MPLSNQFREELVAARHFLNVVYPFYAALLAKMRVIETSEVPTLAVSVDDRLFINPGFFHTLPLEQRAMGLGHECLHPALGIFARSVGHDPELSNEAHDYVINLILEEENRAWMIPGILLDHQYKGMCYEEVYATLRQQQKSRPQPRQGDGEGAETPARGGGLLGDVISKARADAISGRSDDPEAFQRSAEVGDESAAYAERKAREWQANVIAAALGAKAQGRLSAGARRLVDLTQGGVVPWTEKLRLALAETNTFSTLDWASPSRRADATGCFMPRELMQGFDVTVYVDTSGSISRENLETAVREISSILAATHGTIRWLEGDAEILRDEWIGQAPEELSGGGGTSFVPLFDHLRDSPTRTLIVFTDTWGEMPDFIPDYPVIWAVYGENEKEVEGRVVPFGEVIPVPKGAF